MSSSRTSFESLPSSSHNHSKETDLAELQRVHVDAEAAGKLVRSLKARQRRRDNIVGDLTVVAAETSFNHLLHVVTLEACKLLEAERATLFIVDREQQTLWSKVCLLHISSLYSVICSVLKNR